MSRVGLVLGAGGVVGQAYHAGVLAALEHDCGWDARSAEVIVGTSAGSITGTLLRGGVAASDLAAWTVMAPLSDEQSMLHTIDDELPELEPFRQLQLLRSRPALPGPAMVRRAVIRPWHFRPMAAALALMGPGRLDIGDQLSAIRDVENRKWPDEDLWICAVRRRDGRRVVFGRPGSPQAPLHLAMAASCSVPGYFAPVTIGSHTYVDGGAHSPTNAAILRKRELDLVILVSPMSGPAGVVSDLYGMSRRHSTRLAHREVRALRSAGIPVVTFRPDADVQAAMGNDFMSRDNVASVVRHAFLATGRHTSATSVRELLEDRLCA